MKPHKHKDLIIAWADGAEIENRLNASYPWFVTAEPKWYINHEYRVKPPEEKKVTKWLWATLEGVITSHFYPEACGIYTVKLDWSATEFPA